MMDILYVLNIFDDVCVFVEVGVQTINPRRKISPPFWFYEMFIREKDADLLTNPSKAAKCRDLLIELDIFQLDKRQRSNKSYQKSMLTFVENCWQIISPGVPPATRP